MLKVISLSSALLLLAVLNGSAQETVRVRGAIERVEGATYVIRARNGDLLRLMLAADTGVAASVKSTLTDIKTGVFIGVAAVPEADGSLRALEAHIFHESMRGTGEGHRAWDLLPKSTMTNAVVEDIVRAVDGHSVTLRYKEGQRQIFIPAGTIIVTYLPGSVTELQPGAAIFVPSATSNPDGTLVAERVMVGRGIAPPQ